MNLLHQWKIRKDGHGQIFVLLALFIPILLVFLGLSIDFGMAYITKTTLAKAVDATALAAIKNLSAGQTTAAKDGTAVFNANYQSIPGIGTPVVPTMANNGIVWSTDSNNNTLVTVNATATISTFFLSVMDLLGGGTQHQTLTVSASAQAIRNPLVMSLILDRSGSMDLNGGSTALPTAVEDFIAGFDEGVDNVAEISFSTLDTVDVPMTTTFQTKIDDEFPAQGQPFGGQGFGGGTFAQAGLQDGFNQVLSIPPSPNIIRVAVFFTDGWANMNGLAPGSTSTSASTTHDQLNCTGTAASPIFTTAIYGGCSPLEDTQKCWCGKCKGATSVAFFNTSGNNLNCPNGGPQPPANGSSSNWKTAATFPFEVPGGNGALQPILTAETNIANDATYRTEQLGAVMRNSTNNITIYTIGLGDTINTAYLQDLANVEGAATYDPTQPIGDYEYAACETSTLCQQELTNVFQIILSKILLRLTK
ncbi:MAG: pilus assembly protein [Candidatus Binatus sp.]|uniref:TadE/TadG family type IV pilus assembly protein n=1 Tax=Candidatus Binatus sp. TaxID=2811406 RepID=UPI003C77ECE7